MSVGMHADPLDMVAYVRGCLSNARAVEVREHCFACRDCGDQLAAVMVLRGAAPARASVPWYASRSVAAAAGVVLLIGAAAWLVGRSPAAGPDAVDGDSVAAALPEGPSGSPPGAPGFAALTPGDVVLIDGLIAGVAPLVGVEASAATMDDAPTDESSALRAGRLALGDGEYEAAASYLDRFGDSYDNTGTYLLGLALFFEGSQLPDAQRALEAYLAVQDDPEATDWDTADRAAAYYLARLYLDADQLDAARELLRRALRGPDSDLVQEAAQQLLSELQ